MTSKGVKRPYLQTLGNSAISVAGSLHHLRFKKYSILLDCGMAQGGMDIMTTYKMNREQVKKVKVKDVDYIVLTHCHIDHSGLIPAMFAKGCHAHVYVPEGSTPFLKLLWEDSLKIHIQDCQKLQHKHSIKVTPLYSETDIEKALNRLVEIPYNYLYQVNQDITLTYYPAGHIIHSAQVLLELKEGSIIKRVGYTGDVGSVLQPYTEPRQDLSFVNLLVGECTYCTPTRPDKPRDRAKDIEKIKSAINQFNKILIPCFSLHRTQIMLKLFHDEGIFDQISIYLDSPLASKFCTMWDDSEEWNEIMSKVHVIDSFEASERLQLSKEHCIVLSASGFLTGGRIMNHLKTALDKSNNCLMFIGYAGENNLASQIKLGQREVNVDGTIVQNKINIIELRSFSSHASYEALMDYYTTLRYDKLMLVHGEMEGKVGFAQTLQDNLVEQGKSSRVIASNMDTKISF